jgi:multimeric flavodoxin WrbA
LKVRHDFIRLSEFEITPCHACGEAPTPNFCFIDDAMTALYRRTVQCDCLLFGSPIYFDSISAQAKAFIDRCNCMRPADFDGVHAPHHFVRLIHSQRPGAIVLVGGEQAWYEGARRCIAGFFKWIEVTNEEVLKFTSTDINCIGEAAERSDTLHEADRIGHELARRIRKQYGRR